MSDISGSGRRAAQLAERLAELVETDRRFTAVLEDAHRDHTAARRLIDEVEADVRRAIRDQPQTPAAAAALRRFLLDQHHRVTQILTEASAAGTAHAERVRRLTEAYRPGDTH